MTGPVLEIIGVSKRFGANLANDDISMTLAGVRSSPCSARTARARPH